MLGGYYYLIGGDSLLPIELSCLIAYLLVLLSYFMPLLDGSPSWYMFDEMLATTYDLFWHHGVALGMFAHHL
jgi:hypothetical protein